jgi:hypothetical protein
MKKIILLAGLFLIFGRMDSALAYELQMIDDTPVKEDFVLGPGKIDLLLDPGEKSTQKVTVTNRFGKDQKFKVEVEDFSGSFDTDETVRLLGAEKGPYSLKDYIKLEVYEFSLRHGEKITLPMEIEIPQDSQPGGLYASVLVSTVPDDAIDEGSAQAKIISRLGALFFVRVAGDAIESGYLQDFRVKEAENGFYEKGPITFEIFFKNEGNVHLLPSGKLEIWNMLGRKVGEREIDSFFAMPNALRKLSVDWDGGFLMGRYKAVLTLNKNYQQTPAEPEIKEAYFWAVPWKVLLGVFIAILILWRVFKYVRSNFKLEIKKK